MLLVIVSAKLHDTNLDNTLNVGQSSDLTLIHIRPRVGGMRFILLIKQLRFN